jgi:hypothetical protein
MRGLNDNGKVIKLSKKLPGGVSQAGTIGEGNRGLEFAEPSALV